MHNLVDFVQVSKSADNGQCNFAQNGPRDRSDFLVDVIQRAVTEIRGATSASERVEEVQ